jgi:hypothetical protein
MDASAAASQTLYSFDRLLIIRVGTEVEIEMAVANRGQVVLHHVHDSPAIPSSKAQKLQNAALGCLSRVTFQAQLPAGQPRPFALSSGRISAGSNKSTAVPDHPGRSKGEMRPKE